MTNFVYTQAKTDRREAEKWRRDELLKLTGSVLRLSARRQENLVAEYDSRTTMGSVGRRVKPEEPSSFELTQQMRLEIEQIRLLDDQLAESAIAIWRLHASAERNIWDSFDDVVDYIAALTIDPEDLQGHHAALVSCFRDVTRTHTPQSGPRSGRNGAR